MKEFLEANGWKMYYECRTCGRKQYFTKADKPGYEIRTRVNGNTFVIVLNNRTITATFRADQLKEQLIKQELLS